MRNTRRWEKMSGKVMTEKWKTSGRSGAVVPHYFIL